MKSWITITTLACAAFIVAGTTAQAADRYFRGTDGSDPMDWNDTDNWSSVSCASGSGAAVPTANETVEICANQVAEVRNTSAVAEAFLVNSGARIDIEPSAGSAATLTVGDGSAARTSELLQSAELRLLPTVSGNVATLTFHTSQDHTIQGAGTLDGRDDLAVISIPSNRKLTNSLSTVGITGNLEISGAGSFTNQGFVEANNSGTLELAMTGTLEDATGDHWKATAANAILKFDSALVTISTDGKLAGNFVISGASTAEIEINEPNFVTEGWLQMYNGLLDVNENFTVGDNSSAFMSVSDDGAAGSPVIDVAAGKTFIHN